MSTLSISLVEGFLLKGEMDHPFFPCAAKRHLLPIHCSRHVLVVAWGDAYVTVNNLCMSLQASAGLKV